MSDIKELVDTLTTYGTPANIACSVVAKAFIAGHMASEYRVAPTVLVGRDYSRHLHTDEPYVAPTSSQGNRSK